MSKKLLIWQPTTVGILSAINVHEEGDRVIGCQVRLTVDHRGVDNGRMIEGKVVSMGPSDVSKVYYMLNIKVGHVTESLILPLSHKIDWAPGSNGHVIQTDDERKNKYASLDRITDEPDYCAVCMGEIKVQCFKGTGICSTNCEKDAQGYMPVEEARVSAS